MCSKFSAFFSLLLLAFELTQTYTKFEFTNVICTCLDKSFLSFEYCYLKSINRTYKFGSIKVNLYKAPVSKIRLNLAIYQRLNGYKPFLYNVTIDACKFLANNKSSPVARFIFNLFGPYSNINHTCPYNNPIIVDKAPTSHMDYQLTNVLPFPKGQYGFHSIWTVYGIQRAHVNVYGTLS
ncbi:uncharacterized protein LOC111075775 [Drosophila obscura]|uniref:uncharacterized protein LOC111075775 n=1 Tax=Drosophila obscura TaxID=7282 RepID=UPI001BB19671|nr:uncharacterized protein LOC111075775 [Drosophila obscura]